MGVPVPGETALIAAALYAAKTQALNIWVLIAFASAGAIFGDNFGYWFILAKASTRLRAPLALRFSWWEPFYYSYCSGSYADTRQVWSWKRSVLFLPSEEPKVHAFNHLIGGDPDFSPDRN
jgi:hypothetical protein